MGGCVVGGAARSSAANAKSCAQTSNFQNVFNILYALSVPIGNADYIQCAAPAGSASLATKKDLPRLAKSL